MLYFVEPNRRGVFSNELDSFYKLRKDILVDHYGWELPSIGGKEMDQFDHEAAHYVLVGSSKSHRIIGGVRLTPSTSRNLTYNFFSHMIQDQKLLSPNLSIWESSRFLVDTTYEKGESVVHRYTYELFYGMLAFSLSKSVKTLITMTDTRIERILGFCSWPLKRVGPIQKIKGLNTVVGILSISEQTKEKVCAKSDIDCRKVMIYK